MSVANRKGGFFRSLEISRDDSNTSDTVLGDDFLIKTSNYVLQVQHFVSSNVQKLNTVDEVMFEVKGRGGPLEGPDDAALVFGIPANIAEFRPSSYFSIVELGRQLQEWTTKINAFLNAALPFPIQHIDSALDASGRWVVTLHPVFSSVYYIGVGPQTQILTGFRSYIFALFNPDLGRDVWNERDLSHLHLINLGFFAYDGGQDATTQAFTFTSERPLSVFDQRLSLDVVATYPISTKPAVLDGVETNDYVLARFPTSAHQKRTHGIDVYGGNLLKTVRIRERINTGLEDLTENNTEAIGNHMLNGKIRHCNFKLENRYLVDGKIVRQPCDFKNGFFNIKLLFSKRET